MSHVIIITEFANTMHRNGHPMEVVAHRTQIFTAFIDLMVSDDAQIVRMFNRPMSTSMTHYDVLTLAAMLGVVASRNIPPEKGSPTKTAEVALLIYMRGLQY
jgi:hypothetical protein